jgi:polar amino acid transport system substrate-binding protein
MPTTRLRTIVLAALTGVIVLSGCANPVDPAAESDGYPPAPEVERDEKLAEKVPPEVRDAGVITVAMNSGPPPVKFRDADGEVNGFNPQLIEAAATILGIEVEYQEVPFDALVPGLESGRFDVFASAGDFAERRERTDFIDYMTYGTAIMVQSGFEHDELEPARLCGVSVAFTRGAAQQALVEQVAASCRERGEPALTMVPLKDANAGILAVQSGQADAVWGDSPALIYNANREPDRYKVVYDKLEGPYGIGVLRENAELRDALRAALRSLAEQGIYQKMLTDWNLEPDAAMPEFPINTGPSQG